MSADEKPGRRSRSGENSENGPIRIKRGSVEVSIYRSTKAVGEVNYRHFTLSYYDIDGKRVRRVFADEQEARREARDAADALAAGDVKALDMTAADRAIYRASLDALGDCPKPLNVFVGECMAAVRRLPKKVTILHAIEDFIARRPAIEGITVAEAVEKMIAAKKLEGVSEVHLRDLTSRLGRFSEDYQCPIAMVTAPMLKAWLLQLKGERKQKLSNRTKRNMLRVVAGLFHFARKEKFVTREHAAEIAEIDPPKVLAAPTEIFTPTEIRKILHAASDALRPALAIGAFCGLRTAELDRLDWKDVLLSEGVVVVSAKNSKTASRRLAPIPENCARWLASFKNHKGKVCSLPNDRAMNHAATRAAAKVGVTWVRNGLRHSFCSYRLAVTHDPARVALEAGNSPAMIHAHYKALVTEEQAKEWFAIVPEGGAANVLPMSSAAG